MTKGPAGVPRALPEGPRLAARQRGLADHQPRGRRIDRLVSNQLSHQDLRGAKVGIDGLDVPALASVLLKESAFLDAVPGAVRLAVVDVTLGLRLGDSRTSLELSREVVHTDDLL